MYNPDLSKNFRRVAEAFVRAGAGVGFIPPVEWAQKNISLKRVKPAFSDRFDLSLTPYLVDVISSWNFLGKKREIVIVAPEQTGKSFGGWQVGLLWSFIHIRGLSLVVYPSDDKAEKINEEFLLPLMEAIPVLADELELPKTKKADCYRFANFTSYFQGCGSRISAYPAKICVADELADWVDEQESAPKIEDLRKRTRSFDESLVVMVSSPKGGEGSYIWQEFLKTSRGFWHLRCLGCGELTMRSCDIHNLQWAADDDGNIVGDSIRLICPVCKHEHIESDKRELNLHGAYIHENEALLDTRIGFQWGALASQMKSFSWTEIALKQLDAGRTAEVKTQIFFDNSIRGLPFRQRKTNDKEKNTLLSHCSPFPQPDEISAVFLSADTQDDAFFYVIRGVSSNESTYLLSHGKCKTLADLKNVFTRGWNGIPCMAAIIDEGGHRALEVSRFIEENRFFFGYKGGQFLRDRFRLSDNKTKLLLAQAKQYHSDLLYYIYQQNNRENSYWHLPPRENVSDDYINQILDVKPNKKTKNGHLFENWSGSGEDHFFDCEKMMLALIDFAKKNMRSGWRTTDGVWQKKVAQKLIVKKDFSAKKPFAVSW